MILPLTNNPEESFNISISDIIFTFRQLWNGSGFWTLDINDSDGVVLVTGVKIITQEFMLRQYPDIFFDLKSFRASDPVRNNLDQFELGVFIKDV